MHVNRVAYEQRSKVAGTAVHFFSSLTGRGKRVKSSSPVLTWNAVYAD